MTLEDILLVEKEIERLQERIILVKNRLKTDQYTFYGCKETAALKRSALDLRMVISKITK